MIPRRLFDRLFGSREPYWIERKKSILDAVSDEAGSLKAAEKKIAAFEASRLSDRVPALASKAERVGDALLVLEDVGELQSVDELRSLVTSVRERLQSVYDELEI